MPAILSNNRFAYVDPRATLFLDEEGYREVKTFNLRKDKEFVNSSDLDCYKNLPDVFRFSGETKYKGTLFRFPFRDLASNLSSNCFDSKKIEGFLSAFKKEAARMFLFLKNIKKITFEVLNGNTIEDSYVVEISQFTLQKYQLDRETFVSNIKNEIDQGTFVQHSLLYELMIEEISDRVPKKLHYYVSEVFGYGGEDEFMCMIKDKDLSYIPLLGIAYPLDEYQTGCEHQTGGHVFCGLPLPFSQQSLTGLPVHINGYFALGPDRKDLKWKSVSTEKSDDKSVLWNEELLKRLAPKAYLNLIKFLITLKLESKQVYDAWPSNDKVNPKWKIFQSDFYQELMKEGCVFSNGIKKWERPSQIQFLIRKDFREQSEFQVIYDYLIKIQCNVAVVPEQVFLSIQNPIVINRSTVQNIVFHNISIYSSLSQENQNILFSYIIHDQEDIVKFLDRLPLKMVQGPSVKIGNRSSGNVYLPTDTYTKEFLPSLDKVIDVNYYSEENIRVLQEISVAGMYSLLSI